MPPMVSLYGVAMDREALQPILDQLQADLDGLDCDTASRRHASWLPIWQRLRRRIAALQGRLERQDEPLLAVLAGGTGAGKSTLANTLAGGAVSATSARRPTTAAPLALGRAEDLDAVLRRGVLAAEAGQTLRSAPVPSMPEGLVVVDAPDVDSIETSHRATTDRLLEVADVWVWLTTARTYADEAGMAYLRQAAGLDCSIWVILTQAEAAEAEEILPDLDAKLAAAGLRDWITSWVPTAAIEDQQLPGDAAAEVVGRLRGLAPETARRAHRERTVAGALRHLPTEMDELLTAIDEERAVARELSATVAQAYHGVPGRVLAALAEGDPLRREVLRRWTELVGSGWWQRQLQSALGSLTPRRWLQWLPRSRSSQRAVATAQQEVRAGLAEVLRDVLDETAAEVESDWQGGSSGRWLLAEQGSPRECGEVAREDAARDLVRAWEARVAEHVATIGREKLSWARRATAGINATITSAVVVLFTLSGGLTTGEAALAAAGSTTTHTVLSRILGERNVNQLITEIRAELHERVEALANEEAAVYHARLNPVAPPEEAVAALREHRARLEALA